MEAAERSVVGSDVVVSGGLPREQAVQLLARLQQPMLREPSVALALLKLLLSDDVDGRVRAAAGELLLLHTEGYADAPGGGGAGVVVSGGGGGGGGGGSPDAASGGAAHAAAAVAAEKEKEGRPLPRAFFAKAIDDAEIVARLLPTAVTASAAELEHASGGGRVSAEGDTPKSPSQHASTPPGADGWVADLELLQPTPAEEAMHSRSPSGAVVAPPPPPSAAAAAFLAWLASADGPSAARREAVAARLSKQLAASGSGVRRAADKAVGKRVKRAKQRKDSFGRKASSLSKAVGDATERQRVRHAKAAPAAARRLAAVHAGWGARLAAADVAWRHRQRWWSELLLTPPPQLAADRRADPSASSDVDLDARHLHRRPSWRRLRSLHVRRSKASKAEEEAEEAEDDGAAASADDDDDAAADDAAAKKKKKARLIIRRPRGVPGLKRGAAGADSDVGTPEVGSTPTLPPADGPSGPMSPLAGPQGGAALALPPCELDEETIADAKAAEAEGDAKEGGAGGWRRKSAARLLRPKDLPSAKDLHERMNKDLHRLSRTTSWRVGGRRGKGLEAEEAADPELAAAAAAAAAEGAKSPPPAVETDEEDEGEESQELHRRGTNDSQESVDAELRRRGSGESLVYL